MVGEAVGSGIGGGVLVRTRTGTKEVFQSRIDEPSDPGRKSAARRSSLTGGAGPPKIQEVVQEIPMPEQRTISSQLASRGQRDTGTIREFNPSDFSFSSGFRRSLPEASGSFFRRSVPEFITGVGPAIGESLRGRRGAVSEINPFRIFEFTGQRAGEAVVSTPQFGTVTPESIGGFIRETRFEQIRQARGRAGVPLGLLEAPTSVIITQKAGDISADLTSTFQRRIDTGQLTVGQAEKQAGEEFGRRLELQTRDLRGIETERLFKTSGQRFASGVETFAPTVGLAALSVSGPPGAVAAGAIGLAASQQLSVEAGRQFRSGDISGGFGSLGGSLLFGLPGQRVVSGVLGPGTSSTFGRAITSGRLAELERTPFSLGGDIFEGSRGSLGRFSLSRATSSAAQEVEVLAPVFRQASTKGGTQQFSIVGGRFVSSTRVQPFNLPGGADTIRLSESGFFTGRGGIGQTGRIGRSLDGGQVLQSLDQSFQPVIGTLDIPKGSQVLSTGFGGISRRQGESVDLISGTLTGARIPRPGSAANIQTFISSPSLRGSARISKPEDFGIFPTQAPARGGGFGVGDTSGLERFTSTLRGGQTPSRLPSVSAQDLGISFTGGTVPQGGVDLSGVALSAAGRVAQTARLTLPGARGFSPFAPSLGVAPLATRRGALQITSSSLQGQLPSSGVGLSGFSAISSSRTQFDISSGLLSGGVSRTGLDFKESQRGRSISLVIPDTSVISRTVQQERLASRLESRQQFSNEFSPVQSFAPRPRGELGSGLGPSIRGFVLAPLPGFSLSSLERAPRKGRRPRGDIAPSFTGITLFDLGGITGGPLTATGLPTARLVPGTKKKKKKKPKKK